VNQSGVSFGNLSDRLRQAYGLGGDIGASLLDTITPVVILDDLQRPGNPVSHLRRFAFGSTAAIAVGAAGSWALKAQGPIVIDQFKVNTQTTAGVYISLRLVNSGIADPYAIATSAAGWTERNQGASDFAPVLVSSASAFSAAANIGIVIQAGLSVTTFEYTHGIFLQAGDKLIWSANALIASGATISFTGYAF
jgi:hypothetical protein